MREQRAFAIPVGYKNIPTVDIYFRKPLRAYIAERRPAGPGRPIKRLGPCAFHSGGRVVIIRYATRGEMRKIRNLRPERCYYLIDDDLRAAAVDRGLPPDYRDRLTRFAKRTLPEILELCDAIVAPNPLIHAAYPGKRHLFLEPAHTTLCRDFSHFRQDERVRILFAGTRSHLGDLAFISGVVASLCRKYPHIRFTTFLGAQAPDNLKGINNIVHRRPRSWPAFREILRKERFHIMLAPHRDTPFNRARSINKILNGAAFGAAGIYSDMPPISGYVEHGRNGLLVDNHPDAWREAIESLLTHGDRARRLAEEGAVLAAGLGNPARVRDFWKEKLLQHVR